MKKKKIQKENDLSNGADSTHSRLSNKKSMKGVTVQKILGIEDEGPEPLGGRHRLRMMDLIDLKDMYEKEEDDE